MIFLVEEDYWGDRLFIRAQSAEQARTMFVEHVGYALKNEAQIQVTQIPEDGPDCVL